MIVSCMHFISLKLRLLCVLLQLVQQSDAITEFQRDFWIVISSPNLKDQPREKLLKANFLRNNQQSIDSNNVQQLTAKCSNKSEIFVETCTIKKSLDSIHKILFFQTFLNSPGCKRSQQKLSLFTALNFKLIAECWIYLDILVEICVE